MEGEREGMMVGRHVLPNSHCQLYTGESHDVLPASRIEDIVTASSLTDEEIQPLIELLLEKSNANSEWEAVSAERSPLVCNGVSCVCLSVIQT